MSERIAVPMEAVQVALRCQCGAEMWPTGVCHTSYPPSYPHRCSGCGVKESHPKMYPCIEYRECAR